MLARRTLNHSVPAIRSAGERATGPCASLVSLVLAILLGFVSLASDASSGEPSSRVRAHHGAGPVEQFKLSAPVTLSSLVEAGRERRVSVRVPDDMGGGCADTDPAFESRMPLHATSVIAVSSWPHDLPPYCATPPPSA